MSKLERQWWFSLPVGLISLAGTLALLSGAGIPLPPVNASQWMLWLACQAALFRLFSLAGWFIALWFWPASATRGV